jgi:transcriptional regulator with XRE-family HTH domain
LPGVSRAPRDRSQDHLLGPLGQAIRQTRIERGVSQEKLANLTEIERSHMGRIERGEANLSFLNLMKIAQALGTDLSAIIKAAGY